MFAPTKTWRRWHRKINVNQKRYALVSSIAASAIPALVMARGHRIDKVPEVPLVVDNKSIDNIDKTKKAVSLLEALGAYDDVEKVKESRQLRPGKGKMRNRRYVQRRGPLVIYNEKGPLVKAFRNLPGVELCCVTRLNLLQLAPGGHLGRLCIWTKDAFQRLDSLYGTYKKSSSEKQDYSLPRPQMANADIARIINSDEVQSAVREKIPQQKIHIRKKNPLKNLGFLIKLNPYAKTLRRRELLAQEQRQKKKAAIVEAKRKQTKVRLAQKKANKKFHDVLKKK
jgi:large subunit ribosomal protein L4e